MAAVESGAAGPAQTAATGQDLEESTQVLGANISEDPQNSTGAEEAAESLIVCQGAKVCDGTWAWSGGRKVCRGGFSCQGWAAMLAEDLEGEDQIEAASVAADLAEQGSELEAEPINASELTEILTNTSRA